jgi:CRISPR-associated exonuclease Cas4
MAAAWLTLAGALAAAGLLTLWWSHRTRLTTGLPAAEVVQTDTGTWRRCEQPLYSARYGLAGRPDYLVKEGGRLVPVEVKPGRDVSEPYPGDVLQLGAYCLLLEEDKQQSPLYGYLRYSRRTFRVAFTIALRQQVLQQLQQMRASRTSPDVFPNHGEAHRCLRCGHRHWCEHCMV